MIGSSSVTDQGVISKEELRGAISFSEDDDITRIFAEINFIYAEVRAINVLFGIMFLTFGICYIIKRLQN